MGKEAVVNREDPDGIALFQVYKHKESGLEVAPFYLDRLASKVRFSPLGRSREMESDLSQFVKDFRYVGPQSESAEKPAAPKRESAASR